jgi:hypothetical protein
MSAARATGRKTGRANGHAVVPAPSNLPPNPSVGELVTEIDRARHDAARTVSALVDKLDMKSAVRRRAHHQARALGWDGERVAAGLRTARIQALASVPPSVAVWLAKAGEAVKKVPVPVRVGVVAVLVLRLRRRRRH